MGASYDLENFVVSDIEDVQIALDHICEYVRRMAGVTPDADGIYITPLNGLDGDSYWKYDPDDDSLELWLGGTKKWEYNKS